MQSTSSLFRSKTHRLPSSRSGHASSTATAGVGSGISSVMLGAPVEMITSGPRPTASSFPATATVEVGSNLSIFLTNLRLLDLDLREDWPAITIRTFDTKDSSHSQKKRIQSVEWALFHLFCLWDSEEAREKLHPLFPPTDQVQSVSLRAALLRALEQAKKNGVLGRDAIIRKTMLDECRGERLEEVLAVFSSAVLKRAVGMNFAAVQGTAPALAQTLALESRGYSGDRTQLNALILAHRSSLRKSLADKKAARARYADFAELLNFKQRRLARQHELAAALDDQILSQSSYPGRVAALSESEKLDTWRMVRNNWSGNEQWMDALLYGSGRSGDQDDLQDPLLKTPFDRVWRRVQADRLGELESRGGRSNLLEQLEKSVEVQGERLQHWKTLRQKLFREQIWANTSAAPTAAAQAAASKDNSRKKGIDLGFYEHNRLRPIMVSASRHSEEQTPIPEGRYADMVSRLRTGLQSIQTTQNPSLAAFLHSHRAMLFPTKGGSASDISDLEDDDEDMMPPPPQLPLAPATPLLEVHAAAAAAAQQSPSLPRSSQRVLLTKKKSMTLRIGMYHSDEESELMASPSPRLRRAGTRIIKSSDMAVVDERQSSPPAPRSPPYHQIHTPTPIRPRLPPQMILHSEQATPQHMILRPAEERRYLEGDEEDEEEEPPPPLDTQPSSSPSDELADEILAAMNTASPSLYKKPRHTLSLAERTRMSMARSSLRNDYNGVHVDGDVDDDDELDFEEVLAPPRHRNTITTINATRAMDKAIIDQPSRSPLVEESGWGATATVPYEDLVTRTRKSMAGFEASRKKAQTERRRSLRKSKTSLSAASAVSGRRDHFPSVDEGDSTLVLAEELMSGGQDDAEAIFRSRPKIKMSPIPSPSREFE